MSKRVRVKEAEPKIYSTLVHAGRCARDEGKAIDDIEYTLLRTDDLKASWLQGWKARNAEIKLK